jgi:hypothetical protein
MSNPLLPIDHQNLTRAQTADLLRGLSDFIETYPHEAFVVSIDISPGAGAQAAAKPKRTPRQKA